MVILLFIIMIFITVFNYNINKNILIPSFILCISFLLTSGIYVICFNMVQDDISIDTLIVVVGSLLMFIFGEILMCGVLNKGHLLVGFNNPYFEYPEKRLDVSGVVLLAFSLIILLSAYLRFVALCGLAGASANVTSFFTSYAQIRFYIIHGASLELPSYVSIVSLIAPCIAKISVTIITYNLLSFKKMHWKYLPVLVCYLIYLFTTTSRTVYLEFIFYIVVQFLLLRIFLLNKEPRINKETIKPVLRAILIFCILFFGIGAIAQKNESILINIFAYTAAGLLGLTKFLKAPYYAGSFIESRTLQGLFSPLRVFGLKLPSLDEFLPHYYYANGNATSNEYTALMEPIHDFGIVGMLLTRFFLGMIFYLVYSYIMRQGTQKRSYCCIPIFAQLYYALIISSIDDQFSTYIGMYYLYQVIITFLIWRFFVKKRFDE